MDNQYILTERNLNQLISIFNNLAEISAKGDEAIIIVQSRFILKEIIENAISQQKNEDKKE